MSTYDKAVRAVNDLNRQPQFYLWLRILFVKFPYVVLTSRVLRASDGMFYGVEFVATDAIKNDGSEVGCFYALDNGTYQADVGTQQNANNFF